MRQKRLTPGQILLWSAAGATVGLVAGFALSEWLGDVNRPRLRRAAERLQAPKPPRRLSAAATARAAEAALAEADALRDCAIEAIAVGRGAVELRGWVPTRAARALAARTVRAAGGVETVINSILVRGEDDRTLHDTTATDHIA